MRFYNLTTRNTQYEINKIIMSFSESETDYVNKLYSQIPMVEYTNEHGYECMYAILDDFYLSKISELFDKYSLDYKFVDITKSIILNESIRTKYKNNYGESVKNDIIELIDKYRYNWISKDDILDKILEKGINSLTDFDFEILNS